MVYLVPIPDPRTEMWNIPGNIAFVAFPREKTQVQVTFNFPIKNQGKRSTKEQVIHQKLPDKWSWIAELPSNNIAPLVKFQR